MSESPNEPQSPVLSRREALKVLAAVSGAAALTNLPQSWSTPLIEVGVIPAHAQGASGPRPILSNVTGRWVAAEPSGRSVTWVSNCSVTVMFNYQDTLGQVSDSSVVFGVYAASQNFNGSPSFINGTGYTGSMQFPFNSSLCGNGSAPISVQLRVNGRTSQVANGTVIHAV